MTFCEECELRVQCLMGNFLSIAGYAFLLHLEPQEDHFSLSWREALPKH